MPQPGAGTILANAEQSQRIGLGWAWGICNFYTGVGPPPALVGPLNQQAAPANGAFYYRYDGALGATLYQYRNAAWVEITGLGGSGLTTGITTFSQVLTPVALAATVGAQEQTFAVTGLVVGARVLVNGPAPAVNAPMVHARVSALNTLALAFNNATAAANVPAAGTYQVTQFV